MRDVDVRLARAHGPVLERLRTTGLLAALGDDHVFHEVADAIAAGP